MRRIDPSAARVLATFALVAATAHDARALDPVCGGVTCGGHGTCLPERGTAHCQCEEGYAAEALECVPAEPLPRRRSSPPLLRARIVSLAVREAGQGRSFVGHGLDEAPYALRRYLLPSELWCTEFVSWVYRAAGVPLSGGYEGGWMIKNNQAMRHFFAARGRWSERGERAPLPGDYVRLNTRRGGHSGIVRFVAGETLYTVEGNVSQRVRLRRHFHWARNRRIDGFGHLDLER